MILSSDTCYSQSTSKVLIIASHYLVLIVVVPTWQQVKEAVKDKIKLLNSVCAYSKIVKKHASAYVSFQ